MSIPIARYYDPEKNPERAFLAGVALRDISEDEWTQLPAHLQRSADALPFYRKTKPRSTASALTDGPTDEEAPN